MKKRITSLLLVWCMVLSMLPAQAVAAAFSDTENTWAQESIARLSALGVVSGSDGNFRPGAAITRAEVATIYSNLMGYHTLATNAFSDLPSSAWYSEAMLQANAAKIFQGADGEINPTKNITRQEFFVSFARVLGLADEDGAADFTDAADIAPWALPQINALTKTKLLTGISNHNFTYKLEPLREITRAEVAALIDRAFPGIFQAAGTYSKAIKGNAVIAVPNITLSNLKIDGNLIIAEGVGEGEITLDTLTVPARTVMRGGGAHSVIVKGDSTFGDILLDKNANEKPISLKLDGAVHVSGITVQENSAQANILVGAKSSVDAITVHNSGTSLSGDGKVELVTVTANDVTITLPNTKIEVAKGVTGTTVGGKPINGGTITATDKNGDIKAQENGGSSGGVLRPPVVITFDTQGQSAVEPITVAWGSTLPPLPTLNKENATFLGWYWGENLVDNQLSVRENITLTAKFAELEAETLQQVDTIFTLSEQETGLSFALTAEGMDSDAVQAALTLENLNGTGDVVLSVAGESGSFTVTAPSGFAPEGAYRLTLGDGVTFAGQEDVIRSCEFTIQRLESTKITYSDSLSFLNADVVEAPTQNGKSVSGLNVAPFTIDQASGKAAQNTTTGTLKLTSGTLDIGQVVCIYTGTNPQVDPDTADVYEDDTAYVKITAFDEGTGVYSYVAAEAEEVLPTPDVLPVPSGADTDDDDTNNSITVVKSVFDYSDAKYAPLDASTRADVGDFIGFYTGKFNDTSARTSQVPTFGQITSVTETDTAYIIAYNPVTQEEMSEILNYHQIEDIDPDELIKNVDVPAVKAQMERQAVESGFAEKAANFLANTAVQTDGFDNAATGFDPDSVRVKTEDGTQMSLSQLRATGGRMSVNPADIRLKIDLTTATKHFAAGTGLYCAVEVFVPIELDENFTIEVTATFIEELRMSVSASGDIVWAKAWIFSYIDDYKFSANIDIYNYTKIMIKASLLSGGDSFDISGAMEELLSLADDVEQRSGISKLHELYADMMEEESDWVELFAVPISTLNISLIRGIIQVRIATKFVVKIDVKVSIGMEFEYKCADRYIFTLLVFDCTATSNSVRLEDQRTEFTFYVMGTIGVRAGINVEVLVGLFSVDLASIGIGVETGVQARLSGFFLYEYKNLNGATTTNKSSGAMYFEMGIYLEVYFVAGAIGGKYQYQNMLYEKDWPLLTAGSRYNVYDFCALETPLEEVRLKNQNTAFYPPADLFSMQQLDLSTGENTKKQYPLGSFEITFTNPAFSFDGSKVLVTPTASDHILDGNMVIRYQNASLSFTSLPIARTIRLHWDDLNDGGYTISFNASGGSYVPGITALYNAAVTAPKAPIKAGYTFGGWFAEEALQTPYVFSKMGNSNITLHAKWTANTNTPYTVEHWRESLLGGGYERFETESKTGTTDTTVTPTVKTYDGFTAPGTQQVSIAGDGSAVVRYEYRRNSYTLTFQSGYHDDTKDIVRTLKYGAAITEPSVAREGYTFTGWNSALAKTMPAQNLTYTAKWEINSYTVEYWLDGKQVTSETKTQAFESDLTLYAPPLPGEFSTFSGWYTDSGFSTKFTGITMPAKNLVLFGNIVDNAVNYTVKHYKESLTCDGNYLAPETEQHTASKGTSVTPGLKTYEGFTAPTTTQTVAVADDGSTVVEYHYARNKYHINFVKDDGGILASAPETLILPFELEITLPTPTAQGYDFAHWYLASDQEQSAYTAKTMPSADITLKPKFTAKTGTAYTVEHWFETVAGGAFTKDDSKTEAKTGTTGQNTAAQALTVRGFTAKSIAQVPIDRTGETVVRCEYTRNDYTITFARDAGDLLDGALPQPINAKYGAEVTLPRDVEATGYTFAYWHRSGQSDTPFTGTMPAENITLHPKFTPKNDTAYTVAYYLWQEGATYTLHSQVSKTGTTGAQTAAELIEITDHTAARTIEQATIASDGSTVVRVQYYPGVCVYDQTTLLDAVANGPSAGTVFLTEDITLSFGVAIGRPMRIVGNGHTVTLSTPVNPMIAIRNTTNVTISNIKLNGSGQTVTGIQIGVNALNGPKETNSNVKLDQVSVENCKEGGIYVSYTDAVTFDKVTVQNCARTGIKLDSNVNIILNDTVIGKTEGLGLRVETSTAIMNRGEIYENTTAPGVYGGGVDMSGSFFTMTDSIIRNNNAGINGGGVNLSGGGTFTMNGESKIIDNVAGNHGGGIATSQDQGCSVTINGGTISDNRAVNSGGGISLDTYLGFNFTLNDCLIEKNESGDKGGGIYIVAGAGPQAMVTLGGGTITGNTAKTQGGGVWMQNAVATWVNTVIQDNTAPLDPGIGTENTALSNPNNNTAN